MNKNQIVNSLKELGLNEKEATVYFTLLKSGPSSILNISKNSNLKRSTIYNIVNSLFTKKLVRKDIVGIKELIVAENPNKLKNLLELKQENLNSMLPKLDSLYHRNEEESIIKHFHGKQSIRETYFDMISSVKERENYYVLTDNQKWKEFVGTRFINKFREERGKLNINVKMILRDNQAAKQMKLYPNEELKLISDSKHFSTNLVIIPSKVFIHQYEEPAIGMLIENKNMIHTHKEMFEFIWDNIA